MEITALEPVEGGTKLALDGEAEPGIFSKLAEPIVARGAQKQWETNVSRLKAAVEAQPESSACRLSAGVAHGYGRVAHGN